MTTQFAVIFFSCLLAAIWLRNSRFPRLARRFLCLAPFLPIVSLLNHNVDQDRWGTTVRVLPMYLLLLLLLLSFLVWRARGAPTRWGAAEGFVVLYIVFSAAQIPGSADPAWALCTWSWSVPGYLLFMFAGRATSESEFSGDRWPMWTLLGFVGVSVSLIVTGLVTGRADDLFHTRNFGSIYASNALLLFLTVFASLSWSAVRNSVFWSFLSLLASVLAMALSLSRSATLTLAVFLLVIFSGGTRADRKRSIVAAVLVIAMLAGSAAMVKDRFNLDLQLFAAWSDRFYGGDFAGAYNAARDLRDAKFSYFHAQIWRELPWRGRGFGTFRLFSDYTDAHNLLVTEAFENSLLAAFFLVLAYSLPTILRALPRRDIRPIAISALGFILFGQITGGMLTFRAAGAYYTAYPGWTFFYLIGFLCEQVKLRSPRTVAVPPSRSLPSPPSHISLANPNLA